MSLKVAQRKKSAAGRDKWSGYKRKKRTRSRQSGTERQNLKGPHKELGRNEAYTYRQNKKVFIPESERYTRIGVRAFKNKTYASEIILPEGVTSIGEEAFMGCTALKRIVLPKSLVSIGTAAFSGCTSLKEIVIFENVTRIEEKTLKSLLG